MKRFWHITAALLILVMGFGLGRITEQTSETETPVASGFGSETDWILLGEGSAITCEEVRGKLEEIGQLAVYSGTYQVEKDVDCPRYLFDTIRLPGATERVPFLFEGVVKVGYDISAVEPVIDHMNREIRIQLPEAEVLDYYVIWGCLADQETTDQIAPVGFPAYQTFLAELEGALLAQAEAECIYEQAESSIQTIIRNFLAGFDGYGVVFA